MNPFIILKAAIKKVPSIKYALGVAGVCAAISIIKLLGINNFIIPVASICIFLFLMVLLLIFSRIASSKDPAAKKAGNTLMFCTVFIICIGAILFTTSIFFDFPKAIDEYPFFKNVPIVRTDTVKPDDKIIPVSDNVKKNVSNDNNKTLIKIKDEKISDDRLEISIQLETYSKGFRSIKVNGLMAEVLATSTPLNPRVLITSITNKNQIIEIETLNGDTCFLNRVFDKKLKQYFPVRFIPECKIR